MTAMKVLATGDRWWKDVDTVVRRLSQLPSSTILVTGGAPGLDTIAYNVGRELGFDVREYKADWGRFKRAAGPIRNRQMIKEEHLPHEPINLGLAFHPNLISSKGTRDMVSLFELHRIPYEVIKPAQVEKDG